jgi:hypothetical protein
MATITSIVTATVSAIRSNSSSSSTSSSSSSGSSSSSSSTTELEGGFFPQPPPPPPAAAAAVPVVRIVTIPKIPKDNDEEEWQALELEQVPYNPSHVAPARNKMKSLMSCSSVHHALKTQLFVKDVGP